MMLTGHHFSRTTRPRSDQAIAVYKSSILKLGGDPVAAL